MDKYSKLIQKLKEETVLLEKLKVAADKKTEKAKKVFEKNIDRVWSLLFYELPSFKTAAEALKDMQERGYKIKHSKLYNDIRDQKIPVQSDKKIFKSDIDSYILQEELKTDAGEKLSVLKVKTGLKTTHQIALLEQQVKNVEADVKKKTGQWIDRGEAESAWVQRVVEIRAGLLALKNRLSPLVVGKTQKKVSEIIEKETKALLNNFTRHGKFTPRIVETVKKKTKTKKKKQKTG